jgi:hypothetical protein
MQKISLIKALFPFFLLIIFLPKIVVLTGCANIIPPTGGPRDSLPPLLVKVTPPDSSKGFNTKTITFTFDEYIEQPQDLTQNLIISPTPAITPSIESKLKTLTIRIKDTLEPNTTYYYNFGRAIKDVNEGNVLDNFSYIFTTGNALDTMEFSGNVLLAETGTTDTTLIVMLHRNSDDSAVAKERPRYITKLDGKGNFRFRYLKAGTYYLFALKDGSGLRRYYDSTQLFAFADSAVEIKAGANPVTLYAYANDKGPQTPTIGFSGGNRGPGGGRPEDRRLKFTTTLSASVQDLLTNFAINFDQPLRNIDTTKIRFTSDSTFITSPASWELDTSRKKLVLKNTLKENTIYNVELDKDFAEDSSGKKLLKTDTVTFTTKKQADYGSIKISFTNIDLTKNPVLQLAQNGQIVKGIPLTTNEFYQQLFMPGEYELSILYDKNKNGRWDPGQFFGEKKQPELVKPLNKKITIRVNWDNEYEITL